MKAPEFNFDKEPDPDLNEAEARRLRDEGINNAVNHADKVDPGWSDKAYKFFVERFLPNHNGSFMAEEVRSFAAYWDIPLPPNNRAWGGIFNKAAKAGIITRVGFQNTKNKKAHCTPATLWKQTAAIKNYNK